MGRPSGVSARTRFEVFKRDGFRCAYCGGTPVDRPLHVDHVVPVKEGGGDEPSNLVTACQDCNLGKSAIPLDRKAFRPSMSVEEAEDHAQQILEYLKAQREVEGARQKIHQALGNTWEAVVGPMTQDMYNRLGHLTRNWPIDKLKEAMEITASRMGSTGQEFDALTAIAQAKYFHGILRRWKHDDPPQTPPTGRPLTVEELDALTRPVLP